MILALYILSIFNEPILRSAVLPGWGEHTLQSRTKAETFFMIEGGLWLLYGGFHYYSGRMNRSAHSFAVEKADANPARKDDDYMKGVEKYMTSDDHNEGIERDASTYYPDDLERQQSYIRENGFFGEDSWSWSNTDDFLLFWDKRKAAREAVRDASFCVGLALFNRIASIIDVAFFTSRSPKVGLKTAPGQVGIIYKF